MNTVLILGANGRFGQAATQAFAAAGWRVLAQVRRAPAAALPAGATALALPLADTAALVRQAALAQAVVYAVNPPYTRWDREALPLMRQALAVAQQLGATFMLPGNVYNFGSRMPALLREDTPQRADTPNGRVRRDMESELQTRAASGQRSVVIRGGDFYGCGSGSWLDLAIVKGIGAGKLVYPGPLDVPHAWAYLPDLARAFVAVAQAQALQPQGAPFQVLHFAGHTLTGRKLLALIDAAAADLGLRPAAGFRTGGMPWALIRAVGLVYPLWRELARMSYLWRVPHALDGSALQHLVGPLPSIPAREAVRTALTELGLGAALPRAHALR